MGKPKRRKPNTRRRQSLPGRVFRLLAMAFVWFVLISVAWVGIYRFVPPPITATMIGDIVAGRGAARHWMSLSKMDPDMARAAMAGEDSGFCEHHGFDYEAIKKAFERNQKRGHVIRGGSTISQQTAKNVFLWQGGGYFRKGLEAWFTVLIEGLWGKRRIMEVYLNVAETGIGTYGADAGARRYFGHGADHLTTHEAAQIAAVLPLPKQRPGTSPTGFTRRYGNTIARRMATIRNDGLDSCLN
ncbi:monofunctional biosynthetic peptidoglycan transglycosylase [Stakelama marina]|uniref:Biosynthetic peptidoglycan transglycosylase n=1 Tax=Stakelama marina TaxID=2826939 RepID=A0A8T4IDH2_9SPHN|nr:monofunctional biosynthetic peptidoglycan transglycosylase [Stakelama marina]MBR0551904.1 monofunctional biosynthetic peptidoglycan transglycosylase [Stakelama marina]